MERDLFQIMNDFNANPTDTTKNKKEINASLSGPLVSIIIPTYNYEEYLGEAIESALNQTYKNIEVIVVDDGSTDKTQSIIKNYSVKQILQKHQGFATARNNGIKNSKGEFILCLDGDDKIYPSYIEKSLEKITQNPRVGFVTTGSKIWYEETGLENIFMPRKIYFRYAVFAGWVGALGTVLMRRTAFMSLAGGYDSSLPAHEDLDLCFRLLKNWKSSLVFQPLHWYRRHKVVLDQNTVNIRKSASVCLDRKYPYRKVYRMFYFYYKQTFGRLISFFQHPSEYLKSLQIKTQISIQFKQSSMYNNIKAKEYLKQFFDTLDMQVEYASNKELNLYYRKKLALLKYRTFNP
jgi:glycosyltransferase involved in cell wall biosynthesis